MHQRLGGKSSGSWKILLAIQLKCSISNGYTIYADQSWESVLHISHERVNIISSTYIIFGSLIR